MNIEEAKKYIDKILWFIPIKKLRYLLRMFLYNILDIKKIKEEVLDLRYEIRYISKNVNKNIIYFKITNWWNKKDDMESTFFNFILTSILDKYNVDLIKSQYKTDIEIFSVFGDRKLIETSNSKIKIFYTQEAGRHYPIYSDNCIDNTDLSLGFNNLEEKNYIRFPLWIIYLFDFNFRRKNLKDFIRTSLEGINNNNYQKTKFASIVSSWGGIDNLRTTIYNNLIHIDEIKCPSKLLHNDDTLKIEFNNNKIEYLKQFKFNICPENCIEDGYITEKLLEAFKSGCIPIWNGDKNIEGDVINKNTILYWNKDSDNQAIIKEIEKLHRDDSLYKKFISQPRFNIDIAVDYIYERITLLNNKMEELLLKKIINKL